MTSNYFSEKILENNKIINELLIQKQILENRKYHTLEKIKSYESLLNTEEKICDDNNNTLNNTDHSKMNNNITVNNNNDILENLWHLIYKEINKIFYQFINYDEYFLFELIQELFYIIQSNTKEEIIKIFNKLYSLFNLENKENKIKEEMIFNFLPFFKDNIENIFFSNENNNKFNFNEFKKNYSNFIEKNLKEKKINNKLKILFDNIIKDNELLNLFLYIKKFIIYIEILFNKSNLNFNLMTFSDRKMEIKKISYENVLLLFNNNNYTNNHNNKKSNEKFFEGIIIINPPLIRNQFFLTQKLLPFAIKKKFKKSLELNLIRNKTTQEFRIKYKNKKLNNILTNNNNTNSNNHITNNNKSLNKYLYKKNSDKYSDNKKNINKLLNYKENKLNHTNSNFKIIFTRINSFKDTLKNTFPVFTERILTDNNNNNNNYNNGNTIMYSKTITKCVSINNNFFYSCKRNNSLKSIRRDFYSYKNFNKKDQRLIIDDFFLKNRIDNKKQNNNINNYKNNNNVKNKNKSNNNKEENNNFKNNFNNILHFYKQSNSQTAETTINTDKIHSNLSNQNFNAFHDNFIIKNNNNNKKEKNFIKNTNKLNEYKNKNIKNLIKKNKN